MPATGFTHDDGEGAALCGPFARLKAPCESPHGPRCIHVPEIRSFVALQRGFRARKHHLDRAPNGRCHRLGLKTEKSALFRGETHQQGVDPDESASYLPLTFAAGCGSQSPYARTYARAGLVPNAALTGCKLKHLTTAETLGGPLIAKRPGPIPKGRFVCCR